MIQKRSQTPVLYTVPEVARKLSCSTTTVFRYIKNGLLPSVKIGDGVRIEKEALIEVMKKGIKLPEDYTKTYINKEGGEE